MNLYQSIVQPKYSFFCWIFQIFLLVHFQIVWIIICTSNKYHMLCVRYWSFLQQQQKIHHFRRPKKCSQNISESQLTSDYPCVIELRFNAERLPMLVSIQTIQSIVLLQPKIVLRYNWLTMAQPAR